ncbi:MAG: hypothetical protein ACFFAU_17215 [Candidatus Hodarchaeota archaeon]
MGLNSILNTYCRKFGAVFMFIIPLIILFCMLLAGFQPTNPILLFAALFWILLLLNSLMFLLNGLLIIRSFKKEIKKKTEEGFPVESLEGFSAVSRFVTQTLASSSLISVIVAFSLLVFLLSLAVIPTLQLVIPSFPDIGSLLGINMEAPDLDLEIANKVGSFLAPIVMVSAIGLVLIAIGILLLLKIPEKPSFEVGAFLKYYFPRTTPLILDNLLSDSIIAFLDPITRMRFDEWTDSIRNGLRNDFEAYVDPVTRLERAREKILLLFYLKKRMPLLLSEEIFESELGEVINADKLNDFKIGKKSGIDFKVLNEIFDRLYDRMPEIFMTIDKLVIELTDNLQEFRENKDIWVRTSAPEKVIGNENPFRILFFALNKNTVEFSNKKRLINFHIAGPQSHFMESVNFNLALDEATELNIGRENLPFISNGSIDILGILSRILQIGDAVWFTFERKSYKSHLFHLSISEGDKGSIFGETVSINVTRDLMFYIRTYGGKLSAISGLILPVGSLILRTLL